jgi:putative hydrolase of the HAD superfamily
MQQIKTIIFDLGRTLVPFSFDPLEPRLKTCRERAVEIAALYERGKLSSGEFTNQICALTGVTTEEFAAWWSSIFTFDTLIEEQLIKQLAGRYKLGLLSNTNELHFEFVRPRLRILEVFDFFTLSYRVGSAKPDPAIFAEAERQGASRPAEILYFDDVPEYVLAAKNRGWKACIFSGQASVERELAERGITAPLPDC